jgi:trk system potassium uptake protein TrkH
VLLAASAALLRRLRAADGDEPLSVVEGAVLVLAAWLLVMATSSWPFLVLAGVPLRLAAFEAVSGWTTTGLSVLEVSALPPSLLVWRSLTQFAGGAGWAILALSAVAHPLGVGLAHAEGRERQLVPEIRRSSRQVLRLYLAYAALGTAAFLVAGMPAFDALNHALAAVSTGGFSTRPESIGAYGSAGIETIAIVLMTLGATSFVTVAGLLRRRRPGHAALELRIALVLVPVTIALIAATAARAVAPDAWEALRLAAFEVVSATTTTGFTTLGDRPWSAVGVTVTMALMIVGGGHGSTAGGLKLLRAVMALRILAWETGAALRPRRSARGPRLRDGDTVLELDAATSRRLVAVGTAYLGSLAIGTAVLAGHGAPFRDAAFETVSALSTVGLSAGVTSPDAAPAVLWTLMAAMVLGRLEFLVAVSAVVKVVADAWRALRA